VARSAFAARADAPHQPVEASAHSGVIELYSGNNFEHALLDIETWSHLWVVFWFHHNRTWRPKVQPPRSPKKRGVFATRSPYRPNPIGLSLVKLERVDGLELHISGIDLLDETPILDIKPYVPFADQVDNASHGWLGQAEDPHPRWRVEYSPEAAGTLEWLRQSFGVQLQPRIEQVLVQGPAPHAYRRIRPTPQGGVLALKEWRVHFSQEQRSEAPAEACPPRIVVERIDSGYSAQALLNAGEGSPPNLEAHRALALRRSRA
jgi:tRNA-Thr(GGU) m(6)t(6)A37 methyltransferase TsaA